jgi:hypothetical protein
VKTYHRNRNGKLLFVVLQWSLSCVLEAVCRDGGRCGYGAVQGAASDCVQQRDKCDCWWWQGARRHAARWWGVHAGVLLSGRRRGEARENAVVSAFSDQKKTRKKRPFDKTGLGHTRGKCDSKRVCFFLSFRMHCRHQSSKGRSRATHCSVRLSWSLLRRGEKTALFAPFIYKMHYYQDRLGTNIGKTQKKCRFVAGRTSYRTRTTGENASRLLATQQWTTPTIYYHFFECFPYVCPEPVLVKSCILSINGSKPRFYSLA